MMVALAKPQYASEYALPIDTVIHGDALAELRKLPANSIDACVVDPPYGLGEVKDIAGLLTAWINDEDDSRYLGKGGFMGKQWDAGVPGPRYWREVHRVLKPGAHILAFGGTRTYDLLVLALRLSGFECRDMIVWIHGQGFPKSLNIGKITKLPEHQGLGTALKPAQEPIVMARKPLAEKTIAEQVLSTGTGAINIDACRIAHTTVAGGNLAQNTHLRTSVKAYETSAFNANGNTYTPVPSGRFPSNTVMSHSLWCVPIGEKRVRGSHSVGNQPKDYSIERGFFANDGHHTPHGYVDEDGLETVQAYSCVEGCPVKALDEMSGIRKNGGPNYPTGKEYHSNSMSGPTKVSTGTHFAGDTGTASRYFQQFSPDVPFYYAAKASKRDRSANGAVENMHPTCKSQQLMRYLVRMICKLGGVVLDCFAGSGSTLVAAIYENVHFIGIEMNNSESEPYIDIARARIAQAYRDVEVSR